MEHDPKMYHITYIGHHTCKKNFKSLQMISDSDPWESYIDSKVPQMNNQETNLPLSSVKQEPKKEDTVVLCPGEDVVMSGCGHQISVDNSPLDDMNDIMINFVGFDGDFSFDDFL